jgi:hypothetical protein
MTSIQHRYRLKTMQPPTARTPEELVAVQYQLFARLDPKGTAPPEDKAMFLKLMHTVGCYRMPVDPSAGYVAALAALYDDVQGVIEPMPLADRERILQQIHMTSPTHFDHSGKVTKWNLQLEMRVRLLWQRERERHADIERRRHLQVPAGSNVIQHLVLDTQEDVLDTSTIPTYPYTPLEHQIAAHNASEDATAAITMSGALPPSHANAATHAAEFDTLSHLSMPSPAHHHQCTSSLAASGSGQPPKRARSQSTIFHYHGTAPQRNVATSPAAQSLPTCTQCGRFEEYTVLYACNQCRSCGHCLHERLCSLLRVNYDAHLKKLVPLYNPNKLELGCPLPPGQQHTVRRGNSHTAWDMTLMSFAVLPFSDTVNCLHCPQQVSFNNYMHLLDCSHRQVICSRCHDATPSQQYLSGKHFMQCDGFSCAQPGCQTLKLTCQMVSLHRWQHEGEKTRQDVINDVQNPAYFTLASPAKRDAMAANLRALSASFFFDPVNNDPNKTPVSELMREWSEKYTVNSAAEAVAEPLSQSSTTVQPPARDDRGAPSPMPANSATQQSRGS